MRFVFDYRESDVPLVEGLWRTHSEAAGRFISTAEPHWEMVVMRHQGRTHFTVRGPETKASAAAFPAGAEFFGIVFRLGTFMPHLPPGKLINRQDITLPEATNQSFWLLGSAWQIPTFDNADTFVQRLVRDDLIVRDALVEDVLRDRQPDLSKRTIQYRFRQVTGMTRQTIQQIERARQAAAWLEQGRSIADVVFEAGYYDQPHLTRSLKRYVGQTPGEIAGQS